MLGEEEIIGNTKRMNSAFALEAVQLYYIKKKDLQSAMSESIGCRDILIEKARIKANWRK